MSGLVYEVGERVACRGHRGSGCHADGRPVFPVVVRAADDHAASFTTYYCLRHLLQAGIVTEADIDPRGMA